MIFLIVPVALIFVVIVFNVTFQFVWLAKVSGMNKTISEDAIVQIGVFIVSVNMSVMIVRPCLSLKHF